MLFDHSFYKVLLVINWKKGIIKLAKCSGFEEGVSKWLVARTAHINGKRKMSGSLDFLKTEKNVRTAKPDNMHPLKTEDF